MTAIRITPTRKIEMRWVLVMSAPAWPFWLSGSPIDFTIRQPEYALSVRHCLSYERKGHVQAFCAMTRRYCEQRVRQLFPQEKLFTPCRPDFETVICWPDRSGTLVPLGQSLTPRVPFEDITYPCKRTIPTGQRPGNVLPSPA